MSSLVVPPNSGVANAADTGPSLQRKITWTGAFWVSSGVPALVLFSIGAVAAAVGRPAWLVWAVSILFGFFQAFTYAEIAGLFPGKSGGASIYGAVAWVRYSKVIAPLSVWCNWFAWSPVLAIGSGLTAGYILLALFPADSAVHTWTVVLFDLGILKDGLTIRLNATFLVGAAVMLLVFGVQHGGILRSAKATMVLAIVALVPLLVIGIVPILTGDLPAASFLPLVPLARDSVGNVVDGAWDRAGWTLFLGGLFIAAWSRPVRKRLHAPNRRWRRAGEFDLDRSAHADKPRADDQPLIRIGRRARRIPPLDGSSTCALACLPVIVPQQPAQALAATD